MASVSKSLFSSMLSIKGGFVYILTNSNHTVLYTGITGDLQLRIRQHREKSLPGFSSRYNCTKLVYYSGFPFISEAIAEEKRLKAGSRKNKIELINSMNPRWKDLWEDISLWQSQNEGSY